MFRFRKMLTFILAIVMCVTSTFASNFVTGEEICTIDGRTYTIIQDDFYKTVMQYEENDVLYTTTLNKETGDVEIVTSPKGIQLYSATEVNKTYKIDIKEYMTSEISGETSDTLSYDIIDNNNVVSIDVKDKEYTCDTGDDTYTYPEEYIVGNEYGIQPMFDIVLPTVYVLLHILVAAIVSISAAVVISDIAFYQIPKVIDKVKAEYRNNKYKYYMALRQGGSVLIGAGLKDAEARGYGMANIDSQEAGVFALEESDAKDLGHRVSNCFEISAVENHRNGVEGYYDHVHPIMRYGARKVHANLHIWFY